MAIQVPNAAGFIPSQSVFGDLLKFIEFFGKEGKESRAAQLADLKSQTAARTTATSFLGDQNRQSWARIRNDKEANDDRTYLGQAELNQRGAQFKRQQNFTEQQAKVMAEQFRKKFGLDINAFNLRAAESERSHALGKRELDLKEQGLGNAMMQFFANFGLQKEEQANRAATNAKELEQRGKANDASIEQGKAGLLLQTLKELLLDPKSGTPVGNEAINQLKLKLMKSLNPEGIPALQEAKQKQDAVRSAYEGLDKAGQPSVRDEPSTLWKILTWDFGAGPESPAQKKTPTTAALPSGFRRGQSTIFGHMLDGSPDKEDNGVGAFGANTRDPNLQGASLPFATLDEYFGSHRNARDIGNARVIAYNPVTNQFSEPLPIVDKGPAKWTGNALDLTGAAGRSIGATGKDELLYMVLKDFLNTPLGKPRNRV